MARASQEYHLQKHVIGAYPLVVQEDQVVNLSHLRDTHYALTVPSKDYIVLHNPAEEGGLAAVLITLADDVVLVKDAVVFTVTYPKPYKFQVPVEQHSVPAFKFPRSTHGTVSKPPTNNNTQ